MVLGTIYEVLAIKNQRKIKINPLHKMCLIKLLPLRGTKSAACIVFRLHQWLQAL